MTSYRLILMFLLVCTVCFAEPPKTKEDFLVAVRAAYEAKDMQRIHELTWEKGISDWDRKMQDQTLPMVLKEFNGVENVTYEPMPSDFMEIRVAFGKRTEPTYPPAGIVKVTFTKQDKTSSSSMLVPYAVIDGSYYIVTGKSTDLGWKGPEDKQFTVMALNQGSGKVAIHVKYNASGVDVENDQKSPSHGYVGQYIQEVSVTSDSDDADVTLEIRQGVSKLYESDPLKGKGQIHYKKGDIGVSSK